MISQKLNSAGACCKSAGVIPILIKRMRERPWNKSGAGSNGDTFIYCYPGAGCLAISVGKDEIVISYAIDILGAGAVEIHGVGSR